MNKKTIKVLEKIVANKGKCNWAKVPDCNVCPFGRNKNGKDIGCIEFLKAEELTLIDADLVYLNAAAGKLADILMENILKGTNESE